MRMRSRTLLLLIVAVLLASFAFQATAEGACSKRSLCTVGGPEWLGVGDLGMDMSMPGPNVDQPKDSAERWSLSLCDSAGRQIDLDLARSGDVVFGRGNLTSDNGTSPIGASGTVLDGNLNLSLVPVGGSGLYRLTLDVGDTGDKSASGRYDACDDVGRVWSGTVDGSRQRSPGR
ncbi:MAG: hypothetical protein ACXQT2_00700 [Methanotrichaceae archaeon]